MDILVASLIAGALIVIITLPVFRGNSSTEVILIKPQHRRRNTLSIIFLSLLLYISIFIVLLITSRI
jgi:hypothetical protein